MGEQMATDTDLFNNEDNVLELDGSEVADGELKTAAANTRSRSVLNNIITGSPTAINNYKYTTSRKPGGTHAKSLFSNDYSEQRQNVLRALTGLMII
jgi:hypothetical protein